MLKCISRYNQHKDLQFPFNANISCDVNECSDKLFLNKFCMRVGTNAKIFVSIISCRVLYGQSHLTFNICRISKICITQSDKSKQFFTLCQIKLALLSGINNFATAHK